MTPEPEEGISKLPKFEGNWQKLRDLVPLFAPGWEETLDSITTFWRDSASQEQTKLQRFSAALVLDGIPKLEAADSKVYFDGTRTRLTEFVGGINSIIATGSKPEWEELIKIANHADLIKKGAGENNQAIALLEAINETAELGLSPEEIRQRIAQAAFTEVFLVGTHRILNYSAADVGDDMPYSSTRLGKDELISTIRSEPWTTEEQKEAAKTYRTWRKVILDSGNSIDPDRAYDQLEELWTAAKGQGITRKSSLHFLHLAEGIYRALEDGEAFDIDLMDYEEVDDEEFEGEE